MLRRPKFPMINKICKGTSVAPLFLPLLLLLASASAMAQLPAPWNDSLVDHMAGTWMAEGQILGHEAHHEIQAEWVLNHQFLRIHEKTAANAPKTENPYESIWFLGYDPISEKYVLHLMDVFGVRFSETLGWGWKDGNQIKFVFEYPDGPFHTTFRWNSDSASWKWVMEQKGKDGKWVPFGDLKLTKVPS